MDRSPSRFPGGRSLAIAILAITCFAISPPVTRASPVDSDPHTYRGITRFATLSSYPAYRSATLSGTFTASQPEMPVIQHEGESQEPPPGPDLSSATLSLTDMPAGFEPLPESQTASMRNMAEGFLRGAGMQAQAEPINLVAYRSSDPLKVEIVWSFLLSPLSRGEQLAFDRGIANPNALFQALNEALLIGDFGTPELLEGVGTLGNRSIAFALPMTSLGTSLRLEAVITRRGEVVEEVWLMYREGEQPQADVGALARLLDERLAAALGPADKSFRPAGPLVPVLTTYIPTPLDISTEPSVVGTNLLLAALAMLPFAAAAEVFTRTLAEKDGVLRQRFRPSTLMIKLQASLSRIAASRLGGRRSWADTIRLLAVILFYGLVFSLLDRTWNPFSLTGLVLLFNMTVAYGLVGIADDLLQWRALRRWGVPGNLGVRLSNIFIAIASTATSRLLALAPGLMFGTPEALQIDEAQLDQDKQGRLLKISAFTLLLIGFGLWLPTLLTSLMQSLPFPESTLNIIAGLEGFLLVVFAVALENTFVQMLGFPGGFGQALKQRHRWLWLSGLVLVTFLFYHTLLNPRGDLAQGLQEGSVRLFLAVTGIFVIITFVLWLFTRRRTRVFPGVQDVQADVDRLIYALRDAPPEKHTAAVQKMISLGQPAVAHLVSYLDHPDRWARLMAAAALGKMHAASAILPLEKTIDDEDEGVRFMAGIALSALREEFPAEPEAVKAEPLVQPLDVPEIEKPAVISPEELVSAPVSGDSARAMEIARPQIQAEAIQRVTVNKTCPNCGLEIKAEALVCWNCQAKFAIQAKGYCLSCHAVVLAVDGARCAQCGGELHDPHIESRWLSEQAVSSPLPVQSLTPSSIERKHVTAPTSRKLPDWLWLVVGAFVLGAVIWLVKSNLLQAEPESQPLSVAQVSSATPTPKPAPSRTPRPTATRTPRPPTPTPIPEWVEAFAEPIRAVMAQRGPVIDSDFSTTAGRVYVWGCESPGCEIKGGVLSLTADQGDSFAGGDGLRAIDFALEMEFRSKDSGATVMLVYRCCEGYYHFTLVMDDGSWRFEKSLPGDASALLLEQGEVSDFKAEEGNQLLVIARGDQHAFYLNGQPLGYHRDATFRTDWKGFGINSQSNQATVDFLKIRFWNLVNMPGLP